MDRLNYGSYQAVDRNIEKYKSFQVENISMADPNDMRYGLFTVILNDIATGAYITKIEMNIPNDRGYKSILSYLNENIITLMNGNDSFKPATTILYTIVFGTNGDGRYTVQITATTETVHKITFLFNGIYDSSFGYNGEVNLLAVPLPSLGVGASLAKITFKYKSLHELNLDIALKCNLVDENITHNYVSPNFPLYNTQDNILAVLYSDSDYVYKGYNRIFYPNTLQNKIKFYFDSDDYKIPNINVILCAKL